MLKHYARLKVIVLFLILSITSIATKAQYCTSGLYYYACVYGDYIRSVSTTGGSTNISNLNTTCNGGSAGYTFFSSQILTATQGATIGINLVNNPSWSEYYKVWIDYNGNTSFSDPGEQVVGVGLPGNGSFSGSFTIPVTATIGTTRMRVRCVYPSSNSFFSPCSFQYGGEVEDYVVVITGASTPCSGTPSPGNTLSSLNPVCAGQGFTLSMSAVPTTSGNTYQWQSSPNNITWTNISGATGTTYAATQTASTWYRCAVTCTNSSSTGFSTALQVNMNSFLSCYCAAGNTSGCGSGDRIDNVTFGTLNNSSGCTPTPSYTDYGSSVAAPNIAIGNSVPISVTVGPGGTERVAAWIDYNQNGIFETTEFTSIGTGNGSVVSNVINIPSTALSGITKMRVRVRWSTTINNTDPCTTFSWGETEDYNINLQCISPTITTQPSSATLCSGNNVTFSTAATGSGITYQWQENSGFGFVNVTNGGVYSGVTTGNLTLILPPPSYNGYQYRCIAGIACGTTTVISNTAVLTLGTATTVNGNPPHVTICNGSPASFTVNAAASNIGYQWQVYDNTGYYNLSNTGVYSGVNTTTLNISAVNPGMSTYQYRCVVTGTCPPLTVISGNGILTVGSNIPVTAQPQNTTVCAGSTGTFSVTAASSGVIYQWQVNTGSGYANVSNGANYSGATTTSLSVLNTPIGFNGYQYRCVISNSCVAPFFSNAATLSVQTAPTITTQPVNTTSCDFQNTGFSIAATGTGLSYQWQVDAGLGFVNIGPSAPYSGSTSTTLGISSVNSSFNGYIYRCIVTGTCTPALTSNAVTLTITNRPVITAAPTTQVVCEGSSTSYSVTATGTSIGYQWQMNSGSGYTNLTNGGVYSGVTTATLNLASIPNSLHSVAYRCVVTGSCAPPAMTGDAMLFVNSAPSVTNHPANADACVGGGTSYYALGVATTGAAPLGYQWQVNTGTGFTNLVNGAPYGGVTTNTLIITGATTTMNGYTYRCAINNSTCFAINTNAATLTINTLPAVVTQPTDKTVCAGSNTSFGITATGTGLSYQWQMNTGSGYQNVSPAAPYLGSTSPTLTITGITTGMHNTLFRCVVRGSCNPQAISAAARLSVYNPIVINSQSVTDTACEGGSSRLGVRVTGAGAMYQWQLKTSGGYINLTNNPPYSGVNTDSLRISGAPTSINGNIYRCAITETQLCALWYYTGDMTIGVRTAPSTSPATLTTHLYKVAVFTVPSTGTTFQWQEDDNSGGGFRNLNDGTPYAGVYTNTLKIDPLKLSMSGNMYRCIIDGVCVSSVSSKPGTLVIDPALDVKNVKGDGNTITVYPNPLRGSSINVVFNKNINTTTDVKVMDKLGKVVFKTVIDKVTNGTSTLNLTELPAGVYMLQVLNADENISQTIQFTKQ